jgi:hypothetical protein
MTSLNLNRKRRPLMNGKKFALLVAALMTIVGAPMTWADTINFEDGANLGGTPIGNAYQSLGVSFSNATWITSASTGIDTNEFWYGSAGLGVENGVSDVNGWAFPGLTSPIVITFANPMAYVSIDALDVGDNGAGLFAYAGNQLIAQDTAQGGGIGQGNNLTLSVSAPGITSIELNQPFYTSGDVDGLGWDNLTFSAQSVPEPSTLVMGLAAVMALAGYSIRRKPMPTKN